MEWIRTRRRALARLLPVVVALGAVAALTMVGPAPGAGASGTTQPAGHALVTPAGVVDVRSLPPAGEPDPLRSRAELHSPYDDYAGPTTAPGREVRLVHATTGGPVTAGGPTPALLSVTDGIAFTGWEPPDTQLGVGPTRVVEMVNDTGRVLTKGGVTSSTFALSTFFGNPSISMASPSYSDPRVYFDASSSRWFATILVYDSSYNSEIRLAVSQTSDPSGLWTQYAAESSAAGVLFDQPRLGVNDDKVVLTHDDFSTSTYLGEKYTALNKANLVAGVPVSEDLYAREAGKRWLIPARSLSTTTTEYAVHGAGTALTVYAFTGVPGVGAGSSFTTTALTIGSLAGPPDALQPGGGPVDTGSSNVQSVMWRAGTLWSAATDGCTPGGDTTTRACLRFDKVSTTGTPSLVADTRIASSGTYLYYPSVVTTGAGDVFAAFTMSSATVLPSAETIYGQGGSWGASVPGVLYKAGAGTYGGGRWGDYSEIAVDPANDDDVWAAQEYATSSGWWGTSVGQLTAVPPTVTSVVPSSGPNNGGTVVDVYGREFAKTGSVSFGGSTVAFTWVDSTHVVVTSPAHPVGIVDIRVTNAAGTSPVTAADQFTYTHRGGTRAQAHVTMHRFSGNVVLLAAPSAGLGWVCRDVHTNAVVTAGATLSSPSPGVTCDPPAASSDSCTALDAGGYHAVAGGGTLVVRSKCDTLTASQSLTLPFSDPGYSTTVTGTAYTPWRCEADESGLTGPLSQADYWVFCDINVP